MQFKKITLILLIAAFTLTGCAYHAEIIRTPNIPLYNQTVMFGNVQYIPLLRFCNYYSLDWDWDLVSQKINIKKGPKALTLRTNSRDAILNGKLVTLSYPIEYKNGAAYIPTKTATFLAEKIFELGAVPVAAKKIYEIRRVVIDPGHGGKDPGAIGKYGTREKDVVLDVSKRIKRDLERQGMTVFLTRDRDVFISLSKRSAFAKKKNADLFISVHANSARQSRAKGFEVFYLSEATDDNARALAAAENKALKFEEISPDDGGNSNNPTLWDLVLSENRRQSKELAYYICNNTSDKLYMKKRGVKGAQFAVLKGANMPAVLIEVGFLSNRREESNLKTISFRKKLADAISSSIISYKRQYERTNGFSR